MNWLQNTGQTTKRRISSKSENLADIIKTPEEYLITVVLHVVRLYNDTEDSGLLTLYTALKKSEKGHHFKVVQQAVESTMLHYH